MAKLTMKDGVSAEMPGAPEPVVVTDARGRQITLRKPGVLAQFRLVEMMGDSAKNETLMLMIFPVIYVADIDGDKIPSFSKRSQVDALIQRLDEDGLQAVSQGVMDHFMLANEEDQVKNSDE